MLASHIEKGLINYNLCIENRVIRERYSVVRDKDILTEKKNLQFKEKMLREMKRVMQSSQVKIMQEILRI